MEQQKIAVYTDESNQLCLFEDAKKCILFDNILHWQTVQEYYVPSYQKHSMRDIRSAIAQLITRLNDCRIIAGRSMGGLPYQMFNSAGYSIFEISEISSVIFDQILSDIAESATAQKLASKAPVGPEKAEIPGVYKLDLLRLQQEHPHLSSKQALTHFLSDTSFTQLHLYCDHLPPWIARAGFRIEMQQRSEGGICAVLFSESDHGQ
ncbi:Fe-only nitrogenase accessory AnfO family protein [Oscillospiraceae bacterium MB08-C2-2]|nr:Fe-only nitrogenase accessory AnfO family protein [Oscillospiraceae bacterium MB08-C2-2]